MRLSVLNPPALRSEPASRSSAAARWPQPDFMPAPQRVGWGMWVYLGLALLSLGLLVAQQLQLRAQARELDAQWLLLDQLSAGAAGGPSKSAAATPGPEMQARAWALADELRPPMGKDWGSRWQAVEQALPPGLQLQAMDMQGPLLRLEGSAQDAERVMQLVDRLALQARSLPGSEVVLTRLQKPEGPNDAAANELRFEVVRRQGSGAQPAAVLKGRG